MDSKKNHDLELVNVAIQKLLEERRNRKISGESFIDDDNNDQLLLSRLLAQLESLRGEGVEDRPQEASKEVEKPNDGVDESAGSKSESGEGDQAEVDAEEIVKELKKVRRQNSMTHWLLSALIVVTMAWQISEVSLVLKVKDGLNHPFKHLGGFLAGMLKPPAAATNRQEAADKENHAEAPSPLPPLKVPELPHMELPELNGNGGNH